ncbi:MAG: hypothetical protein KDB86_02605 [Actinobacteria bacterium]|nr:hypothetical protein [Actinomycetota bacterium]MCB9388771.1 hypothetical protein [Acidimicrobiia bacterium]
MPTYEVPRDADQRLADKDVTLWPPGSEAPTRLGWLDVHTARPSAAALSSFLAVCAPHTSVIGMGGSSMAPMMYGELAAIFGLRSHNVTVVDTTHPSTSQRLLDGAQTVIAASKSGGTLEVRALLDLWLGQHRPSTVAAITDPGSPLADRSFADGFGALLLADPTVGGRFSALSSFGLAPAAFVGLDPEDLLAFDMREAVSRGAALAARIVDHLNAGRDKLIIRVPHGAEAMALWLEQLIAESTGKAGRGLVPVAAPDGVALAETGDACLCTIGVGELRPNLAFHDMTGERQPRSADIAQQIDDARELGEWIAVWETATALVSAALEVDAFDQPDVASAKAATEAVLAAGVVRDADVASERGGVKWSPAASVTALSDFVDGLDNSVSHIALQAFVDDSPAIRSALGKAQGALSRVTGRIVSLGFGPRYLHSTGQLHKGGPSGIAAIQILDGFSIGADGYEDGGTRPSSDASLSELLRSGALIAAQAQGDADSLAALGRRVERSELSNFLTMVGERSPSQPG